MATGLRAQPIFHTEAALRDDVMNTFSVLTTNKPIGDVQYKDIHWKGFYTGSKLEL